MKNPAWMGSIDVAITVCDREGIIAYMNDAAARTFAADGGKTLLGKSLWDCHPEAARKKIHDIMETGTSNSYTIEKNGVKKFIYQTPWYAKGELRGLVEFSLVIPLVLPHYIRG